jgi:hypothetical protein
MLHCWTGGNIRVPLSGCSDLALVFPLTKLHSLGWQQSAVREFSRTLQTLPSDTKLPYIFRRNPDRDNNNFLGMFSYSLTRRACRLNMSLVRSKYSDGNEMVSTSWSQVGFGEPLGPKRFGYRWAQVETIWALWVG